MAASLQPGLQPGGGFRRCFGRRHPDRDKTQASRLFAKG
jgi:hypothetical protein